MAGRPPRRFSSKSKPSPQAAPRMRKPDRKQRADEQTAEIARLGASLAEAQAKLKQLEEQGVDAYTAQRMEALRDAAQTARGQALDASVARNKAEGDLHALRRAIRDARGPTGWLLRRAVRRLGMEP